MALANRYIGKDLYIGAGASGATAITGDQRTFTVSKTIDIVDLSAGADTDKGYTFSLKDGDASLELLDTGSSGSAVLALFQPGAQGTLLYGPQGTASGKPKGGFVYIVKDLKESYPYTDAVMLTVTFQKSGTALFLTSTDTWS